jgi:uncharacterized membrane protein YfcA
MVNSVAGGGTLLSFPALVWIGRDPILANATNAVALWPGSLSGAFGFRREFGGSARWVLFLVGPSIGGGLLGAFLLLRTPSETFNWMVPYLILAATLLLAAQEPLVRRIYRDGDCQPSVRWWLGAGTFQFVVATYGGYFGAGIGILMLAALGLLGLTDIHQMNALKNLLAACINGVAAIYFAISGSVLWTDGLLMAAAAVVGGYGGAGLARRLGRKFVRRAVVVIGLAMALSLLVRGYLS